MIGWKVALINPKGPQVKLKDLRGALLRGTLLVAAGVALMAGATPEALAFEEKKFIKPVLKEPADGTAAKFEASRVVYDPRSKTATASGTVRITYGPYVLHATKVTYNEKTGEFTANGSVQLREPNGNVMLAETLALKEKFKAGFAHHVKALLTNDVTISARYAKREANGIAIFEDARYTACKNCETKSGDPLWELVSDQTIHDNNEHMLYHTNPRLKIAGHTVFGLPYYEHPDPTVKRKTGWLGPTFHSGDEYGFGVTAPYFIALAPNYDLTLRPMLTTKQGPVADVEWRHRTASGQYNVRGYGVYELSPEETSESSRWRGAIDTHGEFKLSDTWKWGWNGTLVSDKTFLDDYDYDDRRIAKSNVYLTGLSDRDYLNAQALNFQSLTDDISNDRLPTALPYVSGEHYFDENILGGELSLKWNSYSLIRDEAYSPFTDVDHGTQQSRAVGDLRWKSQMIGDAGVVISPFARLRTDFTYTENLPGASSSSETTTRLLPSAGFDMRYPLISNSDYGQSIVSPVFQIIAAADETDSDEIGNEDAITLNFDHTSLFLEDRFTGFDRYEGGTRANVGFTYSFLAGNGGFVRASAGESFHIAGKNSFVEGSGLEGSSSDLVGALTFQPWDSLSLSYEARAEEDLSQLNRQEALLSLTFDRFSSNLGYLNIGAEPAFGRTTDEEWVEADTRVGLTEAWYLFGGLRYDLENARLDYRTAGVEFDCDCMNFKLAYSGSYDEDDNRTDHRVIMSIDFATLGGTKVSTGF